MPLHMFVLKMKRDWREGGREGRREKREKREGERWWKRE